MVGKMVFWKRILTGLLIGGGSGWLVSPHSQQLEARLPWEWSSIPRRRILTVVRTLNCGEPLVEGALFLWRSPSSALVVTNGLVSPMFND